MNKSDIIAILTKAKGSMPLKRLHAKVGLENRPVVDAMIAAGELRYTYYETGSTVGLPKL